MRIAERPFKTDGTVFQLTGNRMDHAGFDCLFGRHRRQNRRQPGSQHRLARARRPRHDQVMRAGSGNFDCPLGGFLPFDVLHVCRTRGAFPASGLRKGNLAVAAEKIDQLQQRMRCQNVIYLRPHRLTALRFRTNDAAPLPFGGHCRRQHPVDVYQLSVQAELAEGNIGRNFFLRNHFHPDQKAERQRQVEMRSFLQQVGRRQVDGDSFGRQFQSESGKSGADPFAAFGHRLVGQADNGKRGHACRNLHLKFYVQDFQPVKSDGVHP